MKESGRLAEVSVSEKINTTIAVESGIIEARLLTHPLEINRERIRLEERELKGILTKEERQKLDIIRNILKQKNTIAVQAANLSRITSQEEVISIFETATGTKFRAKEDASRWIETQVFISTYVHEKDFLTRFEQQSAYMNGADSRSIGQLVGNEGKVDIQAFLPQGASVSISETNFATSISGMESLLSCRVEMGDA
jgi:hypothetical protein